MDYVDHSGLIISYFLSFLFCSILYFSIFVNFVISIYI